MSGCCIKTPVSHCAQEIINMTPWPCCSDEWSREVKTQGRDRAKGCEERGREDEFSVFLRID